jgi:hypothetical protein
LLAISHFALGWGLDRRELLGFLRVLGARNLEGRFQSGILACGSRRDAGRQNDLASFQSGVPSLGADTLLGGCRVVFSPSNLDEALPRAVYASEEGGASEE